MHSVNACTLEGGSTRVEVARPVDAERRACTGGPAAPTFWGRLGAVGGRLALRCGTMAALDAASFARALVSALDAASHAGAAVTLACLPAGRPLHYVLLSAEAGPVSYCFWWGRPRQSAGAAGTAGTR